MKYILHIIFTLVLVGFSNSNAFAVLNDTCNGAQSIVCGDTIIPDLTTAALATTLPACRQTNSVYDLWYKINTGSSNALTLNYWNGSAQWPLIEIVDACAGTPVFCLDNGGFYLVSGLSPNSDYYIRCANDQGMGANGDFFVIVECTTATHGPAAVDSCINAPLINCGQSATGSTQNATYTGHDACINGQSAKDVWYKVKPATNGMLYFQLTKGTASHIGFELYEGCCREDTVLCASVGSWLIDNLNPNKDHYIRVLTDTASGTAGTFMMEVGSCTPAAGGGNPFDCQIPPINDLCVDTVDIQCGDSLSGNTLLATSQFPPSCGNSDTAGVGAWFSVNPLYNGTHTVSTCMPTTDFDTYLHVYTGNCGQLTCIASNDNAGCGNAAEVSWSALKGTTYLVYVSGRQGAKGNYGITLNCPPCQTIAVQDSFSRCGASFDIDTFQVLLNDTYDPSVTLTIVDSAKEGSTSIVGQDIEIELGTSYRQHDTVRYSICDGCGCDTSELIVFTPMAAFPDIEYTANNLTYTFNDRSIVPNETWEWITTAGDSSNIRTPVFTFSSPGTYDVCLTTSSGCISNATCVTVHAKQHPVNADCASAIELFCGDSIVFADTIGLSLDTAILPNCSLGDDTVYGVWYFFEGTGCAMSPYVSSAAGPFNLYVFEEHCDSLVCISQTDSTYGFSTATDSGKLYSVFLSTGTADTFPTNAIYKLQLLCYGPQISVTTSIVDTPDHCYDYGSAWVYINGSCSNAGVHTTINNGMFSFNRPGTSFLEAALPASLLSYTIIDTVFNDTAHVTIDLTIGLPRVDAGNDTSICLGQSTRLGGTPLLVGQVLSVASVWMPGGSLNDSMITNPIASPIVSTEFIVGVTDTASCIYFDTVVVSVHEPPSTGVGVDSSWKISDVNGNFKGGLNKKDQFGHAVRDFGDINNDGNTDLIVGAKGHDILISGKARKDAGGAYVLMMNNDGTVLNEQLIAAGTDAFPPDVDKKDQVGWSVGSLGDFDNNGFEDVLLGAPFDDDDGGTNKNGDRGAVWITMLGDSGKVILPFKISMLHGNLNLTLDKKDYFGCAVDGLGDLDGDGVRDILVGAYGDDDSQLGKGKDNGAVYIVYMNIDGTVKTTAKISDLNLAQTPTLDKNDRFGYSVANIGDVNNDGITDIAVGAIGDDDPVTGSKDRGAVYVIFLNANGTVKGFQKLTSATGNFTAQLQRSEFFGSGVGSIGDMNDDNIPDIAVGASGYDHFNNGTVGTLKDAGAWYPIFLSNAGTAIRSTRIAVGLNGFNGVNDKKAGMGNDIALLDDYNQDCAREIAVGAFQENDGGKAKGAVWVCEPIELLMVPPKTDDSHDNLSSLSAFEEMNSVELDAKPSHDHLSLHLMPNPSTGFFQIKLSKTAAIDRLEVVNLIGKQVFAREYSGDCSTCIRSVDLSFLPDGTYLVKVYSEKRTAVTSLIIQK